MHGGVDKAVCVYTNEHYARWKQELGVDDCGPGWFGENFTVKELSEETACIGDVVLIGTAVVEVSQPRGPAEAGAAMEPSRLAQARSAFESNGLVFPRIEEGEVSRRSVQFEGIRMGELELPAWQEWRTAYPGSINEGTEGTERASKTEKRRNGETNLDDYADAGGVLPKKILRSSASPS